MKKWEYKEQSINYDTDSADMVRWLNNLGNLGWELINEDGRRCIFKRELVEPIDYSVEPSGSL